jgi:polysaccharide export outer membrane protein
MRRIVLTFLMMLLAVPAALAQSASYRIQPGDQLQITVLEDETLNRSLLVTPDGQISVPLAGTVRVAGQTVDAVESTIADRLASNFAVRPNVFVALTAVDASAGLFDVYVLGQVGSPGLREVEAGTTLLQALALAGGPARFAATRRIQLRRTDPATGQEKLYLFNYNAVERGGSITSMIALREGDVIVVPERRLFE